LVLHQSVPVVIGTIGLLFVVADVIRGQVRWYLVAWISVVVLTCEPLVWGLSIGRQILPNSLWQVVLVSIALWLILGPFFSKSNRGPGAPVLRKSNQMRSDV
jgi:hypothetical protein